MLTPVAGTRGTESAEPLEPLGDGHGAVRIGVDEDLGARAKHGVRHRVHVADDHVGLEPGLLQRVRAAVHADQDGLELPDVRADDPQVALVPGAARDNERLPVAEPRLERRELDALGEQAALVAEVAHRVVGELLEGLGHPAALLRQRACELFGAERLPGSQLRPVREEHDPRTVSQSPSLTWSNRSAPGRVDQPDAAANER